MPMTLRRLRRLALLPALALVSSCEPSVSVSIEADVLAGNYVATSFLITQNGQPTFDVLAKGGSLTINIAADSTTTGLLSLPAGTPGGQQGTADMAGKISRQANGTFVFNQPANTFIKQLAWQQFTDALVSTTFLSNTQFQITLRK
jgi:hypothetical protein